MRRNEDRIFPSPWTPPPAQTPVQAMSTTQVSGSWGCQRKGREAAPIWGMAVLAGWYDGGRWSDGGLSDPEAWVSF